MNVYSNEVIEYVVRTSYFEGREHLVVPVVMMVEGVHNGSHGPLLHLASELGRFPGAWDGIPVTVGHPQVDGVNVSANSPEVLAEWAVGRIFNTGVEGTKLKAEAWIDINKCAAISPEALSYIQEHRQLEVSIGVFSDEEPTAGVHNNEQYVAVARNHRPDHLALLPGERGACGWSDGCGIRANKSNLNNNEDGNMTDEKIKARKDLIRDGNVVAINVNEDSYLDLVNKAQNKLDSMDNDQSFYYLEDLYDGYLVYRVRNRNDRTTALYRQPYSINTAGELEMTGERSRVRREVNYVQVNKKVKTNKMTRKDQKPCCQEKIDALIANELTNFTQDDLDWLYEQDEATLEKLTPREPVVNKKKETPQVNLSDYVRKDSFKTVEDVLAVAPAGVKEVIEAGIQANKERRAALVSAVQANFEENAWTEEELNAMSDTMLEKLSKTVKAATDYSINGGGKPDIETNEEGELLLPPGVN